MILFASLLIFKSVSHLRYKSWRLSSFPSIFPFFPSSYSKRIVAACQGKLAVLPVLSTVRSRESKSLQGSVVLKSGMQNETKSHLQFKTDFLNVDWSPLQELAGGVSAKFLQEIHHNLSSQNYKLQAFAKLLDTYNLKSGPIQIDFAEGFPSVIGIASESSRNAINSQSKQTDCPENIYPVFKQESLEALRQMYSVIYKFPL